MERYNKISNKRRREIVLLRGKGCAYKRCAFCDYYLDSCTDETENYKLNASVLDKVTGEFKELEVINSGSVFELDRGTLDRIKKLCFEKGIGVLHFESHYLYRNEIPKLRRYFDGIELKMKLGLETFDFHLRENILKKGIDEADSEKISRDFDEANFLFGIAGQTVESMERDIELGLKYFERICLNIMCENSTKIKPDPAVRAQFMRVLYPKYVGDGRVDILVENTDFGVGD